MEVGLSKIVIIPSSGRGIYNWPITFERRKLFKMAGLLKLKYYFEWSFRELKFYTSKLELDSRTLFGIQ